MNKGDYLKKAKDYLCSVRKSYLKNYNFNNKIFSFSIACSFLLSNGVNALLNVNDDDSFQSTESVYEYIDKNPYLDDEEKESLSYVSDFIDDYYNLLDASVLRDRLQNFDIDYKDSKPEAPGIYGAWMPNINVVKFYYCENSDDISKNASIASHEYYHLLSVKYDKEYSECLSEGVTSLLNYEYSDFKNKDYYVKERQIARMLSLIIGKDKLIQSYLKYDSDMLKKSLREISTNREQLDNLFVNMKELHNINIEISKYVEKVLSDEEYDKFEELLNKKQKLVVKVARNINHFALSSEIVFEPEYNSVIFNFMKDDYEVMEINNKKFVNFVDNDIQTYLIRKNVNSKVYNKKND